jgi:hypothetical protein
MRQTRSGGRGRLKAAFWLLPLLACLAGCGSPKVSGKVTYKGEPLHMGTVLFTAANGWTGTSQINEDGTYSIANVPPGLAKVAVDTPSEKGRTPPGGKAQRRPREDAPNEPSTAAPVHAPVKIPDKYKKPETSGLTFEVNGGRQTYNIALE